VAVLAAVTSGMLAVLLVRSRRLLGAMLLFVVVGIDLAVWWKTNSLTSAASFMAAAAIVAVFSLFLPGAGVVGRRRVGMATCVLSVIAIMTALASWTRVTGGLDRTTTLSGRTVIWDVVIDFVGQRPVLGWGFMAIWTEQPILDALTLRGAAVYEAHSGYLEVLLGAGLLGFAALSAAIGVTIWRAARTFFRCPDLLGLYALMLTAFVLIVNLGETYVGANLAPWILLAVLAGQVSTGKSTSMAPQRDRTRTDVSRG
jgi:O-antigen ligase